MPTSENTYLRYGQVAQSKVEIWLRRWCHI